MAIACKCDRCNKLFEKSNDNDYNCIIVGTRDIYTRNINNSNKHYYDLCPSCNESLKIWLNEYYNKKVKGELKNEY